MNDFRYILRYYIDPGYEEDARIAELLDFCRRGNIKEVMLFFNPEELNNGHITKEELQPWLAAAKKIQQQLADVGILMSLNPWTTLVHSPRGRKLKKGQDFTLMKGVNGKDNKVTACPMCEKFQDYLCDLWGYVAGKLHPPVIWVEDDWRLHNHGRIMEWGGCFCELHLQEFARRSGCAVSREELQKNIYAAGKPHPWRKIWLDINRDAMIEPLKKLRKAVQQNSPATRLALMCAGVDVNSAEGRDWHALQDAVGMEPDFIVRPSISPYTEVWAMQQTMTTTRMIIACLKRPLEVCPELESGPRHGAYSKGKAFAAWEIEQTVCFGAHNVTVNHYDMLGSGVSQAPEFADTLARLYPRLNAVKKLQIDDNASLGAEILISPDISRCIYSDRPGDVHGIIHNSTDWGRTASIMGFSHRFITGITPSKQPRLIGGQILRAFSDKDVRTLLAGSVILDGRAAATLIDMGYGELIGLKSYQRHKHNQSAYAYEEITDNRPELYPVKNPRMTVQRANWHLYSFEADPGCRELSRIRRYDHEYMFSGTLFYENKTGGRIITLAAPMGDEGDMEWFYMGYFTFFRRIFMHNLLRLAAPEMAGAFAEDEPAVCYCVKSGGNGTLLGIFNSITDETSRSRLRLTGINFRNAVLLSENGEWLPDAQIKIIPHAESGVELIIEKALPALKSFIIHLQ